MPGPTKKKASHNQSAIVAQALAANPTAADSSGLLRDIVAEWGGTRNLVRSMKREYDEAPLGSQVRQRYMEMIQRLVIMNTQADLAKPVDPAALADADLELVTTRLVRKVFNASAAAAAAE